MVNTRIEDQTLDTKQTMQATGQRLGHRRVVKVHLSQKLFDQISAEALRREWSFSHMVRHLCEASIEGIE